MSSRTQDFADSATAFAKRSADRITDTARGVEGSLRDGADSLRTGAERSASGARRLVDENPIAAIAIAAMAGGMLVWLMKKR